MSGGTRSALFAVKVSVPEYGIFPVLWRKNVYFFIALLLEEVKIKKWEQGQEYLLFFHLIIIGKPCDLRLDWRYSKVSEDTLKYLYSRVSKILRSKILRYSSVAGAALQNSGNGGLGNAGTSSVSLANPVIIWLVGYINYGGTLFLNFYVLSHLIKPG